MLTPVILSGGFGTRLWPLSREYYPKQLLNLLGGEYSLLQHTIHRLQGFGECKQWLIVSNEAHRFLVADQLAELGVQARVLLEPVGRNTAPAVAAAAFSAVEKQAEAMLVVLPADHLIQDLPAFHEALRKAMELAQADYLVTFGVVPSQAETGYGYIKAGSPVQDGFQVERFVEKPDKATAESYVQSGEYYWNSGMFVFKAARYLEELQQLAPEIYAAARNAVEGLYIDIEREFFRLEEQAFTACPSNSIDYAVMEKTRHAVMVPLDAQWSDVGAWSSLWEVSPRNEDGNVTLGDVWSQDTENCYLRAEYRLLGAIGLRDLVVVETADAVLVAHKDQVQEVKNLVAHLKQTRRGEVDLHRKVHRPWGTYETLDEETRFKVKRITVKPGSSLSLQMHYHRSEHWVVVRGTAKITRNDETFILTENQSTYIPIGTPHRLENPGKLPLEIIEVQSGGYLEEDDIVRFDDEYGR